MHKNILIISASPRRGGHSDTLCDHFMRGAQEAGHSVEKIFLRDKNINFCQGCLACWNTTKGECVLNDDMAEILDKILAVDVLAFGTPVYFYGMNAQLKMFLDRTVARLYDIRNKQTYLIASVWVNSETAMEGTIIGYNNYINSLTNVKNAGHIFATGVNNVGDVKRSPAIMKAYESGKGI